jgi:hypothetical protein
MNSLLSENLTDDDSAACYQQYLKALIFYLELLHSPVPIVSVKNRCWMVTVFVLRKRASSRPPLKEEAICTQPLPVETVLKVGRVVLDAADFY